MATKKTVTKKAPAKKAAKKTVAKKATKKTPAKKAGKAALPTWYATVSGTAVVSVQFEVQAATEEEAWEIAGDRMLYDGFQKNECDFSEIRLNDELDNVWKK